MKTSARTLTVLLGTTILFFSHTATTTAQPYLWDQFIFPLGMDKDEFTDSIFSNNDFQYLKKWKWDNGDVYHFCTTREMSGLVPIDLKFSFKKEVLSAMWIRFVVKEYVALKKMNSFTNELRYFCDEYFIDDNPLREARYYFFKNVIICRFKEKDSNTYTFCKIFNSYNMNGESKWSFVEPAIIEPKMNEGEVTMNDTSIQPDNVRTRSDGDFTHVRK